MRGAIFSVTVPATIMTSDWRGDGRKTPAPSRSRSKREAPVAIISIAQQARPKVIGQGDDLRAQLKIHSTVVVMTFGSICLLSNTPIHDLLCPSTLSSQHWTGIAYFLHGAIARPPFPPTALPVRRYARTSHLHMPNLSGRVPAKPFLYPLL